MSVALIDADVDVGTEAFEKYVHFFFIFGHATLVNLLHECRYLEYRHNNLFGKC
jgi:hypothetical protein